MVSTHPRSVLAVVFSLGAFLFLSILSSCAPIIDAPAIDPPRASATQPNTTALSPSEVYQRLAPSVAFIETPTGTGSGLIVELNGQKYILTNAHVIWPFSKARVVFPNREEFLDTPLVQTDTLVDVAIVGPINTELPALGIDSEYMPITGETVYLIGYPGEDELFPDPALAVGIISRSRTWGDLDSLLYYQTDASSAGGQSGGILASETGEVIGFSGLLFAKSFVLAVSSADLAPRIDAAMQTASDEDALIRGVMPEDPTARKRLDRLENLWDTHGYVVDASIDSDVEVEIRSDMDLGLQMFDSNAEEVSYSDESYSGSEVVSNTVTTQGPQFVLVEQFGTGDSEYIIESSHPIARIDDPDDAVQLTVGETITGSIDYPGDVDWYILPLDSRQHVELLVESTAIDPIVYAGRLGADSEYYDEDDDGGRGMLGSNAQLVFSSRKSGDYLVSVESYDANVLGGFLLSVTEH